MAGQRLYEHAVSAFGEICRANKKRQWEKMRAVWNSVSEALEFPVQR